MPAAKKAAPKKKPAAKKRPALGARMPKTSAAVQALINAKGWQPGNSFWKARTKHGRDELFSSPQVLAEACQEYFDWVEANPLYEAKAFSYEGDVTVEPIPKMRAMTVGSLCIFLNINRATWYDYCKKNDFSDICEAAEQVIREQKFGGAASGLLNHAIIARDLGLVDKRELGGPGGGPMRMVTTEMTPQEAAEAYAKTLRDDEE